jgi:2-polyprenyl-6-methoxyphenol hydroxylase-like FAD-dependent oxidoreductase
MLVVAKKHMPREYIEGQAHAGLIAAEAEGHDPAAADRARVILDTEPHLAFRGLSEVLRRSPRFFFRVKVAKDSDPPRPVRVVLVGDAYATTHFFTGSGVVNGLRAARSFGKALANGGTDSAWGDAEREVTATTDAMHHRAMQGSGNAPLDGPFNEGL